MTEDHQPDTREPLVRLAGVRKSYGGVGGGRAVLDGVDLEIDSGEAVAVLGPSGCGKSTLLNLIGALDRADAGTIVVAGHDLSAAGERALAGYRATTVGFVFQDHHLLPQCTALENVLIPTLSGHTPKRLRDGAENRAKALLDRVGLADRMKHRPGELSGGQRQRVAVARALIHEPPLLLLDEPTGSLDREAADALVGVLLELNRERRVTLVTVTHAERLAARMDRTLRLTEGKFGSEQEPERK